jgi:hypothetical protein
MSGYIGTQPVPQATQTRDSFTATSGQTSFATSGYTPNFLDVYLNGVKLSAADYTASNGSDVVLASGAATGDILEVVAFTTFNSASSSIDDNGNATAITIDSNENVMVSKTTSDSGATAGFEVNTSGRINATRDGSISGVFNRLTSDGDIVQFRKNGSNVGSIGVYGGDYLTIGEGASGLIFNVGAASVRPWNMDNTTSPDGVMNLGSSNRRFKDLYLSGGVYLGGTGSANKLEDYEEGTWTPSLVGYSGTPTLQDSYYTKIGRIVFATCRVALDGTSDGSTFVINNLPFTCLGSTASIFGSNIVYSNSTTAPTYSLVAVGTTQINFYDASGTTISYTSAGVNKSFRINITYFTT